MSLKTACVGRTAEGDGLGLYVEAFKTGPMNGVGVNWCQLGCPVLRRGGQMVWCSGARCEGVAGVMRSLSPARCRFARRSRHFGCRRSSLNGGVPTRHVVGLRQVLVRWRIPVPSCRSMTCWNEIKVHVTGVPLSSIRIDCRLVVVPFGLTL